MVNDAWMDPKVNLDIIKMINYDRSKDFTVQGIHWVFPSPNMPTVDTAYVYPGIIFFTLEK